MCCRHSWPVTLGSCGLGEVSLELSLVVRHGRTMSATQVTPPRLNLNLDNMEITTWGVELALKPIIRSISSLMNTNRKPKRKKGCSKRSRSLVMGVEMATANFVEKGEIIAQENRETEQDILRIVADIRAQGKCLVVCSKEFTLEPCSNVNRGKVVRAAQDLLSSVTRLLVLADMLDVRQLLVKVGEARTELDRMKTVDSQHKLMDWMRRLEISLGVLSHQAGLRQQELKDKQLRDQLGAARAVLRKKSALLFTSCNVSVRYPAIQSAAHNRDNIHRSVIYQAVSSLNFPLVRSSALTRSIN